MPPPEERHLCARRLTHTLPSLPPSLPPSLLKRLHASSSIVREVCWPLEPRTAAYASMLPSGKGGREGGREGRKGGREGGREGMGLSSSVFGKYVGHWSHGWQLTHCYRQVRQEGREGGRINKQK
jgi:hypothetical protein